jgi:WD40 repeat protein
VNYAICQLMDGDRVGGCSRPGYAWNGSGNVTPSPDKRYLAVAGFGSNGRASWSLTDLGSMKTLEPEVSNDGFVSAIAFSPDADQVVVASPVEGSPGAVRLQAFSIGSNITLRASRVVEASGLAERPAENIANPLEKITLLRTPDGYSMATPYGDVIGFRVAEYGIIPKVVDDLLTRLGIPSFRSTSIALDWSATPVGFSPAGGVKFAADPEHFRIAAFQKQSVRLMNFEQGTMLTSPTELSALGDCKDEITAVQLKPDGGLHVEAPSCVADRAPPPPLETLLGTAEDDAAIAPMEVEGEVRLPGEAKAEVVISTRSETP